ncbi:UNVERIFIED_CONTAM: hypothetical protein Sradi_2102800 [Sesamum radiatum]|uniref:Uncharacterized protein n=1 Tax=Sesamum radiatum TaxID=300843 RepID=A0AAW2TI27_SESRA
MDRMQEFQNIEAVRKTILMQEEVFKQQVQELHRIYNLQKKLMQELENRLKITAQTDKTDSGIAAWNQTERETGRRFQAFAARDDPKELSASCSGETPRMPIKFNLEVPAETTVPSNVQTFDEESDVEVELTLSIGHVRGSRDRKKDIRYMILMISRIIRSEKLVRLQLERIKGTSTASQAQLLAVHQSIKKIRGRIGCYKI